MPVFHTYVRLPADGRFIVGIKMYTYADERGQGGKCMDSNNPFGAETAARGGQSADIGYKNIQSDVNLYRGNLSFPVVLANLDGRDGLGFSLQINYSPGSEETFHSSNVDSISSVVGFGWSMPLSYIAVSSRAQKETYNTSYFLASDGGQYPLYQTGKDAEAVYFYAVEHPLWKIRLVTRKAEVYWEILKENGHRFTYGSGDSTEINVAWGNFTGAYNGGGGKQYPVGWYLSKVESPKGGFVEFEYDNIKMPIGDSEFTSEIYLNRMTSSYGHRVELFYELKMPDEYAPANIPQRNRLLYQGICENRYLSRIEVKNQAGKLLYRQILEYSLISSAKKERKRLLMSVTQQLPTGENMPPIRFEYDADTAWLSKKIMPMTGAVAYTYEQQTLTKYHPDGRIDCSSNNSDDAVQTAIGADFIVVCTQLGDKLRFQIHFFDVVWKKYSDDYFSSVSADRARIYTGDGLVALVYRMPAKNSYVLRLYKRSPIRCADWEPVEYYLKESGCPSVVCGDSFVGVQHSGQKQLEIYQYHYTDCSWHKYLMPVDPMANNVLSAGRNCIFGAYGRDAKSVRLMSFYSDENHNWIQGNYLDVPAEVDWDYKDIFPPLSINASIGSAAFFKYDKNTDRTLATLIAFRWDIDYCFTGYQIFEIAQSGEVGNPIHYTIAADTMIGFANTAYRYTPMGYVKCELLSPRRNCEYVYGYGSDLFVGAEFDRKTVTYYAMRFDPYKNVWTKDGAPAVKSVSADRINSPIISGAYAVIGGNVFRRKGNGEWISVGALPKDAELSSVRLNSIGGAYLAYNLNNKNTMRVVPVYADGLADHTEFEGEVLDDSLGYSCGISQFFTRTKLHISLHRLKGNRYVRQYRQSVAAVMKYDFGMGVQNIFVDYHQECSRLDGGSLAFSAVSVIPADKGACFGKTDYLYFNGASPDDFQYPDDPATNVKEYYSHFSGRLYATVEYNAENSVLRRNDTFSYALDVVGFYIVQKRNVRREYFNSFDYNTGSFTGKTAVVETIIENEYDPEYYVLRKSTKISMDKAGRQIIRSRSYRYTLDDDPSALGQNILSERSGSIVRDENTGIVLEAEKYETKMNNAGYLYKSAKLQWNGKGEPSCENGVNWTKTEEVLETDKFCNELTTRDAFGMCNTTIYDINSDVVIAEIADCRYDEALYCGFEEYEDLRGLALSAGAVGQAVTTDRCYSGTRSLLVRAGIALTASVGSVRPEGVLVSFAVYAMKTVTIQCGGVTEILDDKNIVFDCWSRIALPLTNTAAGRSVSFCSDGDFYLDVLFVTPLTAHASATVYGGDHFNVCARHENTLAGTRIYYDRLQCAVANADDFGRFLGFHNTSGDNRIVETFSAKAVSESAVYDCRLGYIDNSLFSCLSDGFSCNPQTDFAVFVKRKSGSGRSMPAFVFGQVSIRMENGKWSFCDGTAHKTVDDTAHGENYMLVKVGKFVRFMGEGKILLTEKVSESGAVSLLVKADNLEDISVFGYIPEASLSINYSDLSGRCIQCQSMTDKGLEVKHYIYNEIGALETETAAALMADTNFGYRENFITGYKGMSEPVSGEVADLFPEAEGYPFSSVKYTSDEQCCPVENSSFGAKFKMGGGHTAAAITAAAVSLPFGIQDNTCIAHSVTGMDKISTTRINDGSGLVMTIEQQGEERIVTAYENNIRGQHEKIYYPNYFGGDASAVGEITYDALGYISSRREPDYSLVRTVYDSYGRLRFLNSDSDEDFYIYHVYDAYGRETEVGSVNAVYNEEELRKTADTINDPPAGAKPSRQIYYYDGTDTQNAYEIGRVSKLITYNDRNHTVIETYHYDESGNVSVYSVSIDGHTESVITKYDLSGRVIARETSDPADGKLEYRYDASGRVKAIQYNGEKIYGTEYDPNGKLTAELFGNMKRFYTYNSAHVLSGIADDILTQELVYDEENFYSGKITEITTSIKGADAVFAQDHRRTVAYDALGRISSVTDTGKSLAVIVYDFNNNPGNGFGGERLEYQKGSNRLLRSGGTSYLYNNRGAVVKAGFCGIEYDRVFEKVIKLQSQDSETDYGYGANGICMHNENGRRTYCVTIGGKTVLERDDTGSLKLFVYGANGIAAEIVNGKIYWLLKDYQGSVVAVSDGGNVCRAYRYTVGGAIEYSYSDDSVRDLAAIGFIGARYISYEEGFGVYRFEHRFYDAKTGRFLSIDPMAQFVNPYVYGNADWINYVDPDGAFSWGIFGAILGGIAAFAAGVALTIVSGGLAAPALALSLGLVGAGLAGAGVGSAVYGISTAVKGGDFDAKDWGITVGCGFAFGALTAGVGAAIPGTCLVGIGCSAAVSTFITDVGTGIVTGMLDGYVTNGFLNLAHGCNFNANEGTAIWQGAVCGAVVGAFAGLTSGFRSNIARNVGARNDQCEIGIGTELHSNDYNHSMLGLYKQNNLQSARDVWPLVNGTTLVQERLMFLGDSPKLRLSRLKVTDKTYKAIEGKLPNPGVIAERFSIYTNSCTGNVINWIAEGGICPPFWVRWPSALRLWAHLASI